MACGGVLRCAATGDSPETKVGVLSDEFLTVGPGPWTAGNRACAGVRIRGWASLESERNASADGITGAGAGADDDRVKCHCLQAAVWPPNWGKSRTMS